MAAECNRYVAFLVDVGCADLYYDAVRGHASLTREHHVMGGPEMGWNFV